MGGAELHGKVEFGLIHAGTTDGNLFYTVEPYGGA
jgi:hypothetical protein